VSGKKADGPSWPGVIIFLLIVIAIGVYIYWPR
jgi:hypothetical protein